MVLQRFIAGTVTEPNWTIAKSPFACILCLSENFNHCSAATCLLKHQLTHTHARKHCPSVITALLKRRCLEKFVDYFFYILRLVQVCNYPPPVPLQQLIDENVKNLEQ